eukprot:3357007-Ditylum_brightwellii.AAC.1
MLWVHRWKCGRQCNSGGNTSLCSRGGCISIAWSQEGVGVIGLRRIENQGIEMEENSDDVIDW